MRLAVALPPLSPGIGPGEISDRARETGLAGEIHGVGGVSLSASDTGRVLFTVIKHSMEWKMRLEGRVGHYLNEKLTKS